MRRHPKPRHPRSTPDYRSHLEASDPRNYGVFSFEADLIRFSQRILSALIPKPSPSASEEEWNEYVTRRVEMAELIRYSSARTQIEIVNRQERIKEMRRKHLAPKPTSKVLRFDQNRKKDTNKNRYQEHGPFYRKDEDSNHE